MTNTEMAKRIISQNRYLTLATANGSEVWIAPLAYAFDEKEKVFYFYSAKESKHSRHVAMNPEAAVAIFNSQAPSEIAEGLQFKAQVEEVEEEKLETIMNVYFEKSFPDLEERQKWARPKICFMGDAPQRFYKIIPLNLFKNIEEKMIDCREQIDLQTL